MPTKYPLDWPESWPRTPDSDRKASRFKDIGFGRIRDELLMEFERLGADHLTLSTDIPTTSYGLPRANAREPDDPGVAVYFQWAGKPHVIACDQYDFCWENMRAIGKSVEALRTIERHGASSILERAVSGFHALPGSAEEPEEEPPAPWWDVLEVDVSSFGVTIEQVTSDKRHAMRKPLLKLVELKWKQRVKTAHPDQGGSQEEMAELNRALAEARKTLGKE